MVKKRAAKRPVTKKSPAKRKPRAAKPRAKPAKPRAEPAKPAKPKRKRAPRPRESAVPEAIAETPSGEASTAPGRRRRALTAREWAVRSSPVVEILDDAHPIGALRRFLDSIKGAATEQQAQIALGSAQLMLLPIARDQRGGTEVKELVDMMLERWAELGVSRVGFHAQEFLRNALAAVGVDRERIARLGALAPDDASAELRFAIACAHAVARDKVAMLRAVEAALDAGAPPSKFANEPEFAPYRHDPDLAAVLARAEVPAIPVDIAPHVAAIRIALDSLVATLRELGEPTTLRPPVKLAAILDAERARKISLPNDYRALLSITNGMVVWGHELFGAGDYRGATDLAKRAQRYLHAASLDDCVPLAAWGKPTSWLLYDPRGRLRDGTPGYVIRAGDDTIAIDGLVAALAWLEELALDELGTN